MAPTHSIFQVLHYSCAGAASLFVIAAILANLGAVENSRRHHNRLEAPRHPGVAVSLLVASYIAEFSLVIAHGHTTPQCEAQIFRCVILTLAWVSAWARRASTNRLLWGTAVVTLPFEVALLASAALLGLESPESILSFSFQALRIASLIFILVIQLRVRIKRPSLHKDVEETESLLRETDSEAHNQYGAGSSPVTFEDNLEEESDAYDASGSDSEDTANIKRRRAKRLREAGGWWGYLKDFTIFLPFLVPKKDRKVQLCLLVSLLCIAANRALRVLIPRQLGIVTDQLLNSHAPPLKALAIWLLLSALSDDGLMGVVRGLAKIPVTQFSYRQITNAAFNHVLSLPMEFHSERDSAEVMKAIEQGEALTSLLETLVIEILPAFIDLALAFGMLYWKFNSYVALTVVVAAAVYVSLDVVASKWNIKSRREFSQAQREEARVMHQAVQGWQTVAYFNMFSFEKRRFGQAVENRLSASRAWTSRDIYIQGMLDLMIPGTFFVVSCLALQEVAHGQASPGDFVFLIQYWEYLIWPLQFLSHNYRYLMSDLIDAERLLHLLQTKPTIVDRDDANDLGHAKGLVAFDHVQFSYDPRNQTLADVTFSVSPGETVALVGETGAGKSSIIKLLLRFYDINAGRITIDGHDIRDITLSSLRNALGVVPQDPLLFNASILENLRYARPSATESEIFEACRSAAIHDKILSFPDGYSSQVGEQGVKLSGGEVQRLAIARVFLKDPPILILDEATSAVDTNTEAGIHDALDALRRERSTLVIAHRLSTIVDAQRILVIHGGRVVESGTHHELISCKGRYNDLWQKQIGGI